ncbi:NlpC/P60 family protein [Amycolatopsis oliviviridis]|uniref:Hydrolase Nlp/P60 n=1 Tax=Amycolatopsis oliviviridis TaxID=1471590 RepID=A0ABQ3LVK9_9PSEU|nr:C40 family peptidase [Amycolatopsis oliviviridis]GHH27463.1 hydrolase Nlp/P60 [Amycolatopsis oliviviridis]
MQSHPVKRVVSGALAAAAVITAVTVAQPAATAAPAPAPQQPPAGSDALAKYRDLAAQAEKANEDLLKAKDDLAAKQGELDKATADAAAAKDLGVKAAGDEKTFQAEVNKFAGASFTSGVQLNKLSSLLSGASTQDFLERSSALEVLAANKNTALNNLSGAVAQSAAAAKQAADAQGVATAARDTAAKLTTDIEARKKTLDDQLKEIQRASGNLSAADRNAQKDKGGAFPNLPAPGPAAAAALSAAKSKLGSPYDWGATGPSSFDCSGLMLWAYKQAGLTLPRSSRQQSTFGAPVQRSQLQPGDLVFYNSPVSHVGMYVGNGMMVHAPTTGDVVKVSPLQNNYVGARRPTA